MASYLQQLDDWVFNDQKTVTYTYLSNNLQVPADIAKRMLYHFSIERPGKAFSTYCISGLRKIDGFDKENHCFALCNQETRDTTKQKFNEITSEHVYAVSPQPLTPKNRNTVLVEADNQQWNAALGDRTEKAETLVRQNSGSSVLNSKVKVASKLNKSAAPASAKVQPAVVRTSSAPSPTTSAAREKDKSPAKRLKRSPSATSLFSSGGGTAASTATVEKGKDNKVPTSPAKSTAKRGIGAMFAAADKRAVNAGLPKKKKKPGIGEMFASRKPAAVDTDKAKPRKTTKKKTKAAKKSGAGPKGPKTDDTTANTAPAPAPVKRKARAITSDSESDNEDAVKPTSTKSNTSKAKAIANATTSANDINLVSSDSDEDIEQSAGDKASPAAKKTKPAQTRKGKGKGKGKKKMSGVRELDPAEVAKLERARNKSTSPAFDTRTEEDLERERAERKRQQEEERLAEEREREQEAPAKGSLSAMFKAQAKSLPKARPPKRKRLKEITRTTDDGFLVVEQVWVEESGDEEDEAPPAKKADRSSAPKKKAAPASQGGKAKVKPKVKPKGGKQASMMSFFGKKK